MTLVVIIPVAVEKLGFSEKSRKSGDKKCLGDWGKSLVELPDAKRFLRIREERVLQQPPLFATVIELRCHFLGFRTQHRTWVVTHHDSRSRRSLHKRVRLARRYNPSTAAAICFLIFSAQIHH
jgi:hypothetical protein